MRFLDVNLFLLRTEVQCLLTLVILVATLLLVRTVWRQHYRESWWHMHVLPRQFDAIDLQLKGLLHAQIQFMILTALVAIVLVWRPTYLYVFLYIWFASCAITALLSVFRHRTWHATKMVTAQPWLDDSQIG